MPDIAMCGLSEYNKLRLQVEKIVFDALSESSYLDRHKTEIVNKIMNATGMTKYTPDYKALYVDLCYKDMARIDGINIEEFK